MGAPTSEQAAKDLESAANEVLELALDVERDPTTFSVKDLRAAVRVWKQASHNLRAAQVAEAREAARMDREELSNPQSEFSQARRTLGPTAIGP
jgi:hypothetical protein